MGGIQPENPLSMCLLFSFSPQVCACVQVHLVTWSKAVTVNLAGTYVKLYTGSKRKKKFIIYVDLEFPEGLETASLAVKIFFLGIAQRKITSSMSQVQL